MDLIEQVRKESQGWPLFQLLVLDYKYLRGSLSVSINPRHLLHQFVLEIKSDNPRQAWPNDWCISDTQRCLFAYIKMAFAFLLWRSDFLKKALFCELY